MHQSIFNSESWKIWEKKFLKISNNTREKLNLLKSTLTKINFSSNLWKNINEEITNYKNKNNYELSLIDFKWTVSKYLTDANHQQQKTIVENKNQFFNNVIFKMCPILAEKFESWFSEVTIEHNFANYDLIKSFFSTTNDKELQYLETTMWLIVIKAENKLQAATNFTNFWNHFSDNEHFKFSLQLKVKNSNDEKIKREIKAQEINFKEKLSPNRYSQYLLALESAEKDENIEKYYATYLLANTLINDRQHLINNEEKDINVFNDDSINDFIIASQKKLQAGYEELLNEFSKIILAMTENYFDMVVDKINSALSSFILSYITEAHYYSEIASIIENDEENQAKKLISLAKIENDVKARVNFFQAINVLDEKAKILPYQEIVRKIENKIITADERIKLLIENKVKFEPLTNTLVNSELAEVWIKEKKADDNFYIVNEIENFWIFNRLHKHFLKKLTNDDFIKELAPISQQYSSIISNFLSPIGDNSPTLIFRNALELALKANSLLDKNFNFSFLALVNDLANYENKYFQQRIRDNLNHWYHQKVEKFNNPIHKNLKAWTLFLTINNCEKNQELLEIFKKAEIELKILINTDSDKWSTNDNEFYKKYQRLETLINLITAKIYQKESNSDVAIEKVESQLNKNIFGLELEKKALLGIFAINQKNQVNQNYLCFYGQPGVGKTALATQFAIAVGYTPIVISISTLKLPELVGHSYTYQHAIVGLLTEEIIKIRFIGKLPLFIFDEIDKIFKSTEGCIEAFLLSILDPNQNKFYNPYLEIDVTLSNIPIICTANDSEKIPKPLWSRLQGIKITPYTPTARKMMLQKNIIPKILKETQFENKLMFTNEAIDIIEARWDSKQGIRLYEQTIRTIIGQYHLTHNKEDHQYPFMITANNLNQYLLSTTSSLATVNDSNPWNLWVLPPHNIIKQSSLVASTDVVALKQLPFCQLKNTKKLSQSAAVTNYEVPLKQHYSQLLSNYETEIEMLLAYLLKPDNEKIQNFNLMDGLKNINPNIYNDIIVAVDQIFTLLKNNVSLSVTFNKTENCGLVATSAKRSNLIEFTNKVINDFQLNEIYGTIHTDTTSISVSKTIQCTTSIAKSYMGDTYSTTKTVTDVTSDSQSWSSNTGKNSYQIPLKVEFVTECVIKTLNHLFVDSELTTSLRKMFISEEEFNGYRYFPTKVELNDEIRFNIQYYNFQVINKLINDYHYPWILILEQISAKLATTIELYNSTNNYEVKMKTILLLKEFKKNITVVQSETLKANFVWKKDLLSSIFFTSKPKKQENIYLENKVSIAEAIERSFAAIANLLGQSAEIADNIKNLPFSQYCQPFSVIEKTEDLSTTSNEKHAVDYALFSKELATINIDSLHDISNDSTSCQFDWENLLNLETENKAKVLTMIQTEKQALSLC